jgi:lipid-A-disaccharide synthase
MIGAYRAGPIEMWIALALAKTSSVILANLVIGENVIPEFMQTNATPAKLAAALRDVLDDTPERRRQLEAFSRLDTIMATGGQPPSVQAADIVLATIRGTRKAG